MPPANHGDRQGNRQGNRQAKAREIREFVAREPKTPNELHRWVRLAAGIHIPRTRVCPGHSSPFEAFEAAYFRKAPGTLWKGSRGLAGKTMLEAMLVYTEACTRGISGTVLGGSLEQSKNLQEYLSNVSPRAGGLFFEAPYAPRHLIAGKPTQTQISLSNGGRIRALTASQNSVRGPHPTCVFCDEIDEMDLPILKSAMGQPMGAKGVEPHFLASSTHQHPEGTMSWCIEHAENNGWYVAEWCYRESSAPDGWLTQSEINFKKSLMDKDSWRIEVELQEPHSEDLIFTKDLLDDVFDKSLGEHEGAMDERIVIVPPEYPYGEPPPMFLPYEWFEKPEFSTGTDWAKTRHATIIHTMKHSTSGPDILAAWERRGRAPWSVLAEYHNERVRRYGGYSMHDSTGVGSVLTEMLTVPSQGFDFQANKERIQMYHDLVRAFENGEVVFPMIRSFYRACRKLTREMLYYDRHTPDEIVAAALERKARAESQWEALIGR